MKNKPLAAVLWDLDSTLCGTLHRQHLIPAIKAGEKTWDDYALLCEDDEPIEGTVRLAQMLAPYYQQIAVSGRSGVAATRTVAWLARCEVPLDRIIMRPAGDFTENGLLKVRAIRQLREEGLDIRLFVEDWPPAAELICEQAGVPVLVVNPCYPDTSMDVADKQEKALTGGES